MKEWKAEEDDGVNPHPKAGMAKLPFGAASVREGEMGDRCGKQRLLCELGTPSAT